MTVWQIYRDTEHRTNQCSSFPGRNFSNGGNARAPIQFRRESQLQHVKSEFPSRTDPSIFTSIAPVLLDQSNKTSSVFPALKSTSHFLAQSIVSLRSDWSSEATDQMPDPIQSRQYYHQHRYQCYRQQDSCSKLLDLGKISFHYSDVLFVQKAGNYIFKVNNRKTRTRCEMCSKLTIKMAKKHYWRSSGVFIFNFENISHLVPVFLLLTLSR